MPTGCRETPGSFFQKLQPLPLMNVANIEIAEFDYPLPEERIAKHPLAERDKCKLLVRNADGHISHHIFTDLPTLLPKNALLVCNNTKVINARIRFKKPTGATIEIFCLEPIAPIDYAQMFQAKHSCRWLCLIGNLKRWKDEPLAMSLDCCGHKLDLSANKIKPVGNAWEVEFIWNNDNLCFADVIDAAGFIPIPPYLNRESEASDLTDYQTVYSKIKGSVAAPTAGLHFTDEVFENIDKKGIERAELTLHVGAGTFQPVKSQTIGNHPMHTEVFSISKQTIEQIIRKKNAHSPIVAVGTTSVRTLESLPYIGNALLQKANPDSLHVSQWDPYNDSSDDFDTIDALNAIDEYMNSNNVNVLTASTAILIAPSFKWRMVDAIVTNFHQPQSTLLLLVSAFIDRLNISRQDCPEWKRLYDEALDADYRFLSYGDSSLLTSW